MLASAPLGQQQCAQPYTQREFKWASLPARPTRSGRRTGPQPVHSLAMGISSSSAAQIGVLSNVASATIVALGALWWVQQNRSEVRALCLILGLSFAVTGDGRPPAEAPVDANASGADHGLRSRVPDVRGHRVHRLHLPPMERWRCGLQQLRWDRQACSPLGPVHAHASNQLP